MAWIGKSQGFFKLYDSDNFCGSLISIEDASEILSVDKSVLLHYGKKRHKGLTWVSELDLHKGWSSGVIPSPLPVRSGSANRSFDELILHKLINITYPQAKVKIQVPFGRKRLDLEIEMGNITKGIEFLGPGHFIQNQYKKVLKNPFDRKMEAEDKLGYECILWPYWIQRCSRNIKALFDDSIEGIASVWSTKAHFGDFVLDNASDIIIEITERFRAIRKDGIAYMYLDQYTSKPIHPVIERIKKGIEKKEKLIPPDNSKDEKFWVPDLIV